MLEVPALAGRCLHLMGYHGFHMYKQWLRWPADRLREVSYGSNRRNKRHATKLVAEVVWAQVRTKLHVDVDQAGR